MTIRRRKSAEWGRIETPRTVQKSVLHKPAHRYIFWPANTPERDQAFKAAWEQIQAASQPTASFLISQEEDDLIRISSQKTDTSFLVESEGLWDYLLPDIQNGTINLSKGKYADLYDRRVDD